MNAALSTRRANEPAWGRAVLVARGDQRCTSERGTEAQRGCLVDVPRAALHLSPLGDLLGVVVMVLLPGFPPASIQGLQMRAAGDGAVCEDCRPVALKLGFSPTVMALRLEEAPLVRFGLAFDRRHRPDLWPLRDELARVRQAFPELTTIELHVDDEVEVDLLVAVTDLCIGAGFPNVIVGPRASEDP